VARKDDLPPVLPSLLDRLTDLEPRIPRDIEPTREESEIAFRRGVLRDVEWLLNTRRSLGSAGARFPEARDSVLNFGIPDLSSVSADSQSGRSALLSEIQEALRIFEPRLEKARVELVPTPGEEKRRMHFVVEGMLRLDSGPIRVLFDTELEIGSGRFRIREEEGRA